MGWDFFTLAHPFAEQKLAGMLLRKNTPVGLRASFFAQQLKALGSQPR